MGLTFSLRALAVFIYFPFYLLLLIPVALFLLAGALVEELPRGLLVYIGSIFCSIPSFIFLLSFPYGPVRQGNWYLVFSHLLGGLVVAFAVGLVGLILGVYLIGK